MNPEAINKRFHLKEASQRLVNPAKFVVEEALHKLKDSVSDSFQRTRVVIFNEEAKRIYRLSKTPNGKDCGLFVEGLQLNDRNLPEEGMLSIQLPTDPEFVNKSSLFLLRGERPQEMMRLAKEIEIGRVVESHIYDLCVSLLGKRLASRRA